MTRYPVRLINKISIGSRRRLPFKFIVWNYWGMWRRKGEIQKKRLIAILFSYPFHCFFGKRWQNLIRVPTFHLGSRSKFPFPFLDIEAHIMNIHNTFRQPYKSVIFHPCIGREINGPITKIIIKPPIQRSTANRSTPVYILRLIKFPYPSPLRYLPRRFIFKIPIPSQMPFTNTSGLISVVFKYLGQGNITFIKKRFPKRPYNTELPSPMIGARKKGISTGGTNP